MPILKNAKKKVKVIAKKKTSNNDYKASMRTAVKNLEKTIATNDKSNASDALNKTIARIDKAAKKGVIHGNKAARNKSRLTKLVNDMK